MTSRLGPNEIVPTPADVGSRVAVLMGNSLLGAYLYGSATSGGLHAHSDVDVLAVLDRGMTEDGRRALMNLMLEISGARAPRGPGRPVELTLVVQSDVRPWRYPPRAEFQYGEWLRDDYERGHLPSPSDSPDLVTLLFQVLASGRPLVGPPPSALLDPVPVGDLRRAMLDSLPALLADLDTDRNVVLTLARMWMTMETGRIEPKDVAADWALARLPGELRPPLSYARDWYLGHVPEEAFDPSAARMLGGRVVAEIETAYRPEAGAA